MDKDGFFYLVDRKDDLIISGGFNVYPSDIENMLVRHPGVKEAAVIGMPDRIRGESVLAFIVREDKAPVDKLELLGYCRNHMAAFKSPKDIVFVDSIPRSPVGNPLRRLLRQNRLARRPG